MTGTSITPDGDTEGRPHRRRGLLIGVGALVVVLAIAVVIYAVTRDDDGSSPTTAANFDHECELDPASGADDVAR